MNTLEPDYQEYDTSGDEIGGFLGLAAILGAVIGLLVILGLVALAMEAPEDDSLADRMERP